MIKKAEFFTSMKNKEDYPQTQFKEIAFAGKSNVGKSSLINYIANNSKLAYVSKQPGKTRLINYFTINGDFFIVDLPGYGYAKVSKEEKNDWVQMLTDYFEVAKNLLAVLILVDIRHMPTKDDIQMINWANYYKVPYMIVATKADKIAKSKRHGCLMKIAKFIEENADEVTPFNITYVSSMDKKGKEDIFEYIEQMRCGS